MLRTQIAEPLGQSVDQAAAGIRAIVNNAMAEALRMVSVERGHDPRDFAMIAFGGAGPLHACDLAEELVHERGYLLLLFLLFTNQGGFLQNFMIIFWAGISFL